MIKFIVLPFLLLISACDLLDESNDSFFANFSTQDLYNSEIHPTGSSIESGFDATLEEVLHMITQQGYANAYPSVFGEVKGSTIAGYMDAARGGYYESVPDSYPDSAWYHYSDKTCSYACQITEYFYWALSSILGAQEYTGSGSETRYQQVKDEWKLNTKTKMSTGDPNMYALMTDGTYKIPTVIPNGSYAKSNEIGIAVSSTLPSELSQISSYFSSYVSVFGIHVVATSKVDNAKLLHAAYVLAEYLDNNEDGTVDDPDVLAKMKSKNCILTIAFDSDEMDSIKDKLD